MLPPGRGEEPTDLNQLLNLVRIRGIAMAKCDEGYLCQVCGGDVGAITESSLYLRFVIGWIDAEVLHTSPERHIRCDPTLAQYIVDPGFQAISCDGEFDKRKLDNSFVAERESLVTRGWKRLREVAKHRGPIIEYPLPEVIATWGGEGSV